MKIDHVTLHHLRVPLKSPFETSFVRITHKDCILVELLSDGIAGYAESVAFADPYYNEETTATIWLTLEQFLIPKLRQLKIEKPQNLSAALANVRRNYMAISALESAVWDIHCKQRGISLSKALGGTRSEIDVGVSIGIEASVETVLSNIEGFLAEGYKRIKVKIKPGFDIALIRAIRKRFGAGIPLMADANSAYTLNDLSLLRQLDEFGLMMIEQPLAHDDIVDHAKLQAQMRTPICLDESIHTIEDARKAIEIGSCRIINIKIGRVGGLANAVAIHDLCQKHKVPVWCGGMFELGVGRAHNIALASLPNFTIPGDTSASSRSYRKDVVTPAVDFKKPGVLEVPKGNGIGYEIDKKVVEKFTVKKQVFPISR